MKTRSAKSIKVCAPTALACVILATIIKAGSAETQPAPPSVRTIKFPAAMSIGSLLLISDRPRPFTDRVEKSTPIAVAKGLVTVKVPAGKLLLLEANDKVFQNPKLLDEITPPQIDALKIGFMGMRDDEYGACDKALAHVGNLKNLQLLDVSQSDASDAGISQLKSLKKLREVSVTESRVIGICLKDLVALPLLTDLKMDRCAISTPQLAALKKFPALRNLEMRWSNLDNQAAQLACNCAQLQVLDLSRNKKLNNSALKEISKLKKLQDLVLNETSITDAALVTLRDVHGLKNLHIGNTLVTNDGMKTVAEFKNLSKLHIQRTKVTMEGLKRLQGMKLTELSLPKSSYDKGERDALTRMFPGTKFIIAPAENSSDDLQKMYAPIPQ